MQRTDYILFQSGSLKLAIKLYYAIKKCMNIFFLGNTSHSLPNSILLSSCPTPFRVSLLLVLITSCVYSREAVLPTSSLTHLFHDNRKATNHETRDDVRKDVAWLLCGSSI